MSGIEVLYRESCKTRRAYASGKINGPQHGKYCADTVASLLATDSQSTNLSRNFESQLAKAGACLQWVS
jgi:hypothetical protein